MANAPYGVRLAVGAAATVIEETRKLPQTILMYPMTLVSQAAHLVMRWQQNVADLVIKGDETLEALFPPKDEQPEWATFDEDLEEVPGVTSLSSERDRRPEGRVALKCDTLTLAQLRARLQSLSVEELDALLSYEEATKARAPFQTLLANRITRASAK